MPEHQSLLRVLTLLNSEPVEVHWPHFLDRDFLPRLALVSRRGVLLVLIEPEKTFSVRRGMLSRSWSYAIPGRAWAMLFRKGLASLRVAKR